MRKSLTAGIAVFALVLGSGAVVAASTPADHNTAVLEANLAGVGEAGAANQGGDQGQSGELAQIGQGGEQGQSGEMGQIGQGGDQGQSGEGDTASAAAPKK